MFAVSADAQAATPSGALGDLPELALAIDSDAACAVGADGTCR